MTAGASIQRRQRAKGQNVDTAQPLAIGFQCQLTLSREGGTKRSKPEDLPGQPLVHVQRAFVAWTPPEIEEQTEYGSLSTPLAWEGFFLSGYRPLFRSIPHYGACSGYDLPHKETL